MPIEPSKKVLITKEVSKNSLKQRVVRKQKRQTEYFKAFTATLAFETRKINKRF